MVTSNSLVNHSAEVILFNACSYCSQNDSSVNKSVSECLLKPFTVITNKWRGIQTKPTCFVLICIVSQLVKMQCITTKEEFRSRKT